MTNTNTIGRGREPEARVSVKRVVALMNAGAGAFNEKLADDVRATLVAALAQHGVTVEIRLVEGESLTGAARRALVQAKRGEIDAIVVGGGDGSIRTVAGVLAETG